MISRKEKNKIKKIHLHTQTDEKTRKIQLSAKTLSNPLIQPSSLRQPLLERHRHFQPLGLHASSLCAATLCNHTAFTVAKMPSPSCELRPLHPTAPCWELVEQNLRSLLLGAHGQGRVRPVAWEHLLVLGHERLQACMRTGSHGTPKSWTGPEHCLGATHVQPLRKSPTAPRGAAPPRCKSGSLIREQRNGLAGFKN